MITCAPLLSKPQVLDPFPDHDHVNPLPNCAGGLTWAPPYQPVAGALIFERAAASAAVSIGTGRPDDWLRGASAVT